MPTSASRKSFNPDTDAKTCSRILVLLQVVARPDLVPQAISCGGFVLGLSYNDGSLCSTLAAAAAAAKGWNLNDFYIPNLWQFPTISSSLHMEISRFAHLILKLWHAFKKSFGLVIVALLPMAMLLVNAVVNVSLTNKPVARSLLSKGLLLEQP